MTEWLGPRALTKDEFQLLLQRAAERDVHQEPRLFTLSELVDAGREIGIAPTSVQEVYAEYQSGHQHLSRRRAPPLGLRFHLVSTGDSLRLVQSQPRNATNLATRVLTAVASGAVVGMIASFMELWVATLVGSAVAVTAFAHFTLRGRKFGHELRLWRDGSGVLMRYLGNQTETFPLMAGQVHARTAAKIVNANDQTWSVPFLALDHGIQTFELLENYSPAELAWAAQEIESWLGRRP
jgi:hypothetical protein